MIYGERIRLRAPERADIPRFAAWLNDPDVRDNLMLYLPLSHADEEHWFDDMLQLHPAEHPFVIEIRQGDGWQAIGNCSFNRIDWRVRTAEVGIFIGEKQFWNQGYGTETMRLLLRHGFQTLNLNRIFLRVYETNPGGIRAYEKAGFVLEGRLRQAEFRDGRPIDIFVMSVLRSEWAG